MNFIRRQSHGPCDPINQLSLSCSDTQGRKDLGTRRFRGKQLTEEEKRDVLLVRAFRLGQQFKHYGDNPFAEWHHPLSQALSKSFLLGAGEMSEAVA